MEAQPHREPDASETTMKQARNINVHTRILPPIDDAAPTLYETASFGLG
jgi:hypothetical protein